MEKYILYGTGMEAENFLFQNVGIKRNIVFCFDREKKEKFHDLDVFQFDKSYILKEKYKIIVAVGNKEIFDEIAHILCNVGMKEWEDFIWSKTFNKKVVLINANCHGLAIQNYLEQSNTFCNNYFIYPVPAVHLNKDKELSKDLIKNVDVFIHQDIKPDNSISYKLSDEYIRKYLSPTVLDICIPNFVGMGKWMFSNLGGLDKISKTAAGCRHVTLIDYVLDEATKCCNTLEEYKNFWNDIFIVKRNYINFIGTRLKK